MSYGLNKTVQMCTVKTESGLGYKVLQKSESKSKFSKNGLKSGLKSKSGLEYNKSDFSIIVYCYYVKILR